MAAGVQTRYFSEPGDRNTLICEITKLLVAGEISSTPAAAVSVSPAALQAVRQRLPLPVPAGLKPWG